MPTAKEYARAIAEVIGLFALAGLLVLVVAHIAGCTAAQKQVAVGVLDLSNAICDELGTQPEPAWVAFTCTVIEAGSGVAHTFQAKVKRVDAPAFAARHCQEAPVAP